MATKSNRGRNAVIAALVLIMGSGCGKTPASPAGGGLPAIRTDTGGPVDRCKQISQEELAAIMGKPVKPGVSNSARLSDGCEWKAADGKGTIIVQVFPPGIWNDLSGGQGQHAVPGVGEKAYLGPSPLGGMQAGALVGDAFYHVSIDLAPSGDAVVTLLKAFVARAAH